MDNETKEYIVKAFKVLNHDVIININKNFNMVARRLDDLDKRLETIESRLNGISKDTNIIPDIFNMLEDDGKDIAHLTKRIDKLEN